MRTRRAGGPGAISSNLLSMPACWRANSTKVGFLVIPQWNESGISGTGRGFHLAGRRRLPTYRQWFHPALGYEDEDKEQRDDDHVRDAAPHARFDTIRRSLHVLGRTVYCGSGMTNDANTSFKGSLLRLAKTWSTHSGFVLPIFRSLSSN